MRQAQEFGFGLETEFLLVDRTTGVAQTWENLSFARLNTMLEQIPFEDVGTMDGLELEAPHRKNMPFVVEGYHVPNGDFEMVDIRPKGVEIRTPVKTDLEHCLQAHTILLARLQQALAGEGLAASALSHHPSVTTFSGPQNKRRVDFWRWAMEAMLTYGPDVNVSVPADFARTLDPEDLEAKVNAYAPAMAAFSVDSPFLGGQLWRPYDQPGKSMRTWRRSVVAPAIEIHPEEDGRLEFKVFEMSHRQSDYRNYFLLFLTLLLEPSLKARASASSRIYELGAVARFGIGAAEIRERASELLLKAPQVLREWGFDSSSLRTFEDRFERRYTPADDLIARSLQGQSIEALLLERCQWIHD
jgi:carboxylate-amine ligase